jgi:hypothetical protein
MSDLHLAHGVIGRQLEQPDTSRPAGRFAGDESGVSLEGSRERRENDRLRGHFSSSRTSRLTASAAEPAGAACRGGSARRSPRRLPMATARSG